jgi:predicted phage baseplate assembly protein
VFGNVILAEQHATFDAAGVFPAGPRGEQLEPGDPRAVPGTFVVPLQGATRQSPGDLEGWQMEILSVASAAPYDDTKARARPAAAALVQDPALTRPCVVVRDQRPADESSPWTPTRSFLTSARFARDVVVDIDDPGVIRLQFGDGTVSRALPPDAELGVQFGAGGGPAGNVGRKTVKQIHSPPQGVTLTVTNWLPAEGGREAETAVQIKARAPIAFHEQERCVTLDDYAAAAKKIDLVQDAAATLAWTGSGTTVVVHVLPQRSDVLDDDLRVPVMEDLSRRRLAGTELDVQPPRYVPVEVALRVGLAPGYAAAPVSKALEAALGAGTLADGRKGFFHRDGLGFGQTLQLAPVIACAAAVPGVAFVRALRFRRWDGGPAPEEPDTTIALREAEIARLRGDLERPGRGLVWLELQEAP